jgi:DUF1009 family protein
LFISQEAVGETRPRTFSSPDGRVLRSDRGQVQSRGEVIGLLAGSGRFPILFAEAARRQGLQVACVGIRYEAPDELRALCASFDLVGVARMGAMIRAFRRRGVR